MRRVWATCLIMGAGVFLAACTSATPEDPASADPLTSELTSASDNTPAAYAGDINDVTITECALRPTGSVTVTGTIKNSRDAAASFIASIDIEQSGKRIDGVGLVVVSVQPGKQASASATGTRTGISGKISCRVADVSAVNDESSG